MFRIVSTKPNPCAMPIGNHTLPTVQLNPQVSSAQDDIEEIIRNGIVIERNYYKKDLFHRLNGPARTKYYYPSGNLKEETYIINSKTHRVNNCAYITYYESGKVKNQYYYLNNKRHSRVGPALISYFENGNVSEMAWYFNNKAYNFISPNKPSYLTFYENGQLWIEKYTTINNNWSCYDRNYNDGPATSLYDKDGNFICKEYYKLGKLHNLIGPAVIIFDGGKSYCINGVYFTMPDWQKQAAIELQKEAAAKKTITNNKPIDPSNTGCYCRKCGAFENYTIPDGPDGKVICWGCKAWK